MNYRTLWSLLSSFIVVAGLGCGILSPEAGSVSENQVLISRQQQPTDGPQGAIQPVSADRSVIGIADASSGEGGEFTRALEPAVLEGGSTQIPSGATALFYRASFGSDTQNLKTVVTDTRGGGNLGVADISWDRGSKGIVRFIPETGQTDVIKTIVSTSYSKSSIYPLTVGNRLYSIRDWGSDWTVENKRFTVEELDPQTGTTLSSTDIVGEWLTLLNDRVYFQKEITHDFWTRSRGGGELAVKSLGASVEQPLAVEGVRLYAMGDHLVSVGQQVVRWHDAATGEVQSTNYLEALAIDKAWPDARHLFFGDKSMFWVAPEFDSAKINIVRAQANMVPEVLVSFDLEGYETGLLVDEHRDKILIAFASSAPPRGIGITQIFMLDTSNDSITQLPVEQFMPSAQPAAGGGLQLLVMP